MGFTAAIVVALFLSAPQIVEASGADSANPMVRSCVAWYRDIENLKSVGDPALAPNLTHSSHLTGGKQIQKTLIFADSKLSSAEREKIAEGIRSSNIFLRDRFAIPMRVNIDAPWESPTPFAIGRGRMCELSFPQRYICEGHLLSELQSVAIGEHEYGHAIFKSHMTYLARTGKFSTRYRVFSALWEENRKMTLLLLEQKNLKLRLAGPQERFMRRGLEARVQQLDSEIELQTTAVNLAHSKLGGVPAEFFGEYSELFADMLPIAKRNDPKSVAAALGPEDAVIRDASQVKSVAGWLRGVPIDSEAKTHVLAPTMSHVWSRYLAQASSEEERVKVLEKVFEAIAKECDLRLDQKSLWVLSAEERNRRLIESIDGVMRVK